MFEKNRVLCENGSFCVFDPPFWGAYRQRRMFILGSLESSCRLPISDNELFSLVLWQRRYTSENSLKITVLEWDGSLWSKISGRRGHPPPTICAQIDSPVNALQLCRWQFSHKETLQQTFFETSTFSDEKMANLRFPSPFGGLRGNDQKDRVAYNAAR